MEEKIELEFTQDKIRLKNPNKEILVDKAEITDTGSIIVYESNFEKKVETRSQGHSGAPETYRIKRELDRKRVMSPKKFEDAEIERDVEIKRVKLLLELGEDANTRKIRTTDEEIKYIEDLKRFSIID